MVSSRIALPGHPSLGHGPGIGQDPENQGSSQKAPNTACSSPGLPFKRCLWVSMGGEGAGGQEDGSLSVSFRIPQTEHIKPMWSPPASSRATNTDGVHCDPAFQNHSLLSLTPGDGAFGAFRGGRDVMRVKHLAGCGANVTRSSVPRKPGCGCRCPVDSEQMSPLPSPPA